MQNQSFQSPSAPSRPTNEKIHAIINFFKKNQERIILTTGAILIAALAFGAGRLSNQPSSSDFTKETLKGDAKIPIKKEIQKQRENVSNKNQKKEDSREDENEEADSAENLKSTKKDQSPDSDEIETEEMR